jgi:XTP/dITP diphosphohydrolase
LLDVLGDRTDRAARFRTAIALVTPDGSDLVVEGVLEGVITKTRRGSAGFGYDPIFEVNGRTLAEVGLDEKNTMSHRALALRALVDSLTEPDSG